MACHQAALFVLISYQIVSHGATSSGQNFKIQRVAVIGAESAQDDPHSKNLNRSGDLKYYTLKTTLAFDKNLSTQMMGSINLNNS